MIDRFRSTLGNMLLKAASLSFIRSLAQDGLDGPRIPHARARGLQGQLGRLGMRARLRPRVPEPEMHVFRDTQDGKEKLPDHPVRQLIARPNPYMGEDELWAFVITYMALGGNCYLWKERSRSGAVVGLWPLHDGHMCPCRDRPPGSRTTRTTPGDGLAVPVAIEDVIHLRWAPDPLQPTRGLAPLVAAARAVDTDNEALRYTFALLKNDAVPRTILTTKLPLDPKGLK
jgi:phage portal protein BeeE